MKVLVYFWGSECESQFCDALEELQIEYVKFAKEIENYHADAEFAQGMLQVIHNENVDVVFSYDYFPLISMLCEINKIPYISWIYDCPQYTLWSKTLISPYNYIFCFDRVLTEQVQQLGALYCVHFPLAGNLQMLKVARDEMVGTESKYSCDISFIGNLYNGKKNRFRSAKLSAYAAGYTEGMINAQQLLYGYNVIKDVLPVQQDVLAELLKNCHLSLGKEFYHNASQLAVDTLGMEVSARERETVLRELSDRFQVTLYTASEIPGSLDRKKINIKGYADYRRELPLIYHNSKINLNITSKTIESGIPQRIFDILACGGFCITNYQSEIAEYFEEGKELVMYYDMQDLVNKVEYYLTNQEEREVIAENGYRKIKEEYGLKARVREMFLQVIDLNS